jgi:hypothetical protein
MVGSNFFFLCKNALPNQFLLTIIFSQAKASYCWLATKKANACTSFQMREQHMLREKQETK